MRLTDLESRLYALGWNLERIRGSHRHYRHTSGYRFSFAIHGRTLEPDEFAAILRRLEAVPVDTTPVANRSRRQR